MPRSLELWTPRNGAGKPGVNSQVDWTNPLARGLVGLWLFNEGAGLTIRNYAAPHRDTFTADVTGLYAPEVEGLGFNGGLTHYASLLSPSAALKPTQATIFWRGLILGAPGADSNGPAVAGGYFDTANSTPFNTFSIDRINPADIIFEYNVGGSYNSITLTSGASGTNAIMDFALTVASSGATGYKNGVSAGTGAGGSITYGATANYRINRHGATSVTDDANSFAQIVAIWNRPLRATEVLAVHLDPYQLFVPEETAKNIWLMPTVVGGGSTPISVTDSSSASTDTLSATASFSLSDASSAAGETLSFASIPLTLTDTSNAASDSVSVQTLVSITDTSGVSSESVSLAPLALTIADTSSASTEAFALTNTFTLADTSGAASDSVSVNQGGTNPLITDHAGASAESITLAAIPLTLTDVAGSVTDGVTLGTITPAIADTSSASISSVAVQILVTVSDTSGASASVLALAPLTLAISETSSTAAESILWTVPVALSLADAGGAAADAVAVNQISANLTRPSAVVTPTAGLPTATVASVVRPSATVARATRPTATAKGN